MTRLFVLAAAAAVVLLALRHPAPPAAIAVAPHGNGRLPRRAPATRPPNVVVYVVGAVRQPGVYALPPGARVQDALRKAGGLRADADPAAVNLAQHVADGQEIAVARQGEATPRPARHQAARKARTAPAAAVDLNVAGADALATLPGIGPTLAERIVEYRQLNGPFASVDELADVAGMTQRRIDAVVPYLTVHDAR